MICIHIGFFSQFLSVILQLRLRSADLRLGMFPDGQLAAGESMDVSAGGASVDRCLGEIRGGCGGDVTRNDGVILWMDIILHQLVLVIVVSHCKLGQSFNGNFRILKWRYLPYTKPIC